jgi:hypothetical protein
MKENGVPSIKIRKKRAPWGCSRIYNLVFDPEEAGCLN